MNNTNSYMVTDVKEILGVIENLGKKRRGRDFRLYLRKSGMVIAKEAKANVKSMPKLNDYKPIQKGIRTVAYKDGTGVIVTLFPKILYNKKKGTRKTIGSHLAIIFEVGTKKRFARWSLGLKKRRKSVFSCNRGFIKAGNFLVMAEQSKKNEAIGVLKNHIEKWVEEQDK